MGNDLWWGLVLSSSFGEFNALLRCRLRRQSRGLADVREGSPSLVGSGASRRDTHAATTYLGRWGELPASVCAPTSGGNDGPGTCHRKPWQGADHRFYHEAVRPPAFVISTHKGASPCRERRASNKKGFLHSRTAKTRALALPVDATGEGSPRCMLPKIQAKLVQWIY
jgi:hypothetical protein